MKVVALILVISSLFPFSCPNQKKALEQPPKTALEKMPKTTVTDEPSYVRLQNASPFDFSGVRVVFPSQEERFERIEKGQASDYRLVKIAYRYAYIELLTSSGQKLVLQPMDYSGEPRLGKGHFTYVLNLSTDGKSLNLKLVRDE